VSIKRLNNFFQTANIDKSVVIRDPDSGKTALALYWSCCRPCIGCFSDTLSSVNGCGISKAQYADRHSVLMCENYCILSAHTF